MIKFIDTNKFLKSFGLYQVCLWEYSATVFASLENPAFNWIWGITIKLIQNKVYFGKLLRDKGLYQSSWNPKKLFPAKTTRLSAKWVAISLWCTLSHQYSVLLEIKRMWKIEIPDSKQLSQFFPFCTPKILILLY